YVTWSASATFCMRWPLTTSRTAWARRETRASWVCFKNVSKVGRASSGKCSLRVRIRVVSRIKYYKNISTPRHPTWLPYYRSTAFPPQISRKLLKICARHRSIREFQSHRGDLPNSTIPPWWQIRRCFAPPYGLAPVQECNSLTPRGATDWRYPPYATHRQTRSRPVGCRRPAPALGDSHTSTRDQTAGHPAGHGTWQ